MKKKKLFDSFPDDLSIYQSNSEPDKYYAIQIEEVKRMDQIKLKFGSDSIPDSEIVDGFKIGKVAEETDKFDIYDIIEKEPVICRVNDLISMSYGNI